MRYAVIYTYDYWGPVSNFRRKDYEPPNKRKWRHTEMDNRFNREDLLAAGTDGDVGRHGKFCQVLTQDEFDAFVGKHNLTMSSAKTRGAIGQLAPDGESIIPGIAPAHSFGYYDEDNNSIMNAYVTPYPENSKGEPIPGTPKDWKRITKELLTKYG